MQQWFPFFGNFTSTTLSTPEVFSLFLLAEDTNSIRLKAPTPSTGGTQSWQNHLGWEPCSARGSEFLHSTNSTPGVTGSRAQAMPTAPDGCEPKQPKQGALGLPDTLHSPRAPVLQEELWCPLQAEVMPCAPWAPWTAQDLQSLAIQRSAVPKLSESPELRFPERKKIKKKRQAYVRVPINITTFVLNSMFKYH